ncbi:hypothetical protein Ancab_030256 [Ancistrocladus abbreviatus]
MCGILCAIAPNALTMVDSTFNTFSLGVQEPSIPLPNSSAIKSSFSSCILWFGIFRTELLHLTPQNPLLVDLKGDGVVYKLVMTLHFFLPGITAHGPPQNTTLAEHCEKIMLAPGEITYSENSICCLAWVEMEVQNCTSSGVTDGSERFARQVASAEGRKSRELQNREGVVGAGGSTLSDIYQSAKKLLLKTRDGLERLEWLESSTSSASVDSPELSLQSKETLPSSSRSVLRWTTSGALLLKVEQIAEESELLKESLDKYFSRHQRRMLEAKERAELLGRVNGESAHVLRIFDDEAQAIREVMDSEEGPIEKAAAEQRERLRALKAAQELHNSPDEDSQPQRELITTEEESIEQVPAEQRERLRDLKAAQELHNTPEDDLVQANGMTED